MSEMSMRHSSDQRVNLSTIVNMHFFPLKSGSESTIKKQHMGSNVKNGSLYFFNLRSIVSVYFLFLAIKTRLRSNINIVFFSTKSDDHSLVDVYYVYQGGIG